MERVICRGRKRCLKQGIVRVSMKCSIVAKGTTKVFAKDNAKVTALDESTVNAYDNTEITAYHKSKIFVFGTPTIIQKDPGVLIVVGFGKPKLIMDLNHERSTVNGKTTRRLGAVASTCASKRRGSGKGNSSTKSGNCKAKARSGSGAKSKPKVKRAISSRSKKVS